MNYGMGGLISAHVDSNNWITNQNNEGLQTSENNKCTECNKLVKAWSMKSHMKLHSKQQTQYSCNICSYKTIHSHNLKRHVVKAHMNQ